MRLHNLLQVSDNSGRHVRQDLLDLAEEIGATDVLYGYGVTYVATQQEADGLNALGEARFSTKPTMPHIYFLTPATLSDERQIMLINASVDLVEDYGAQNAVFLDIQEPAKEMVRSSYILGRLRRAA